MSRFYPWEAIRFLIDIGNMSAEQALGIYTLSTQRTEWRRLRVRQAIAAVNEVAGEHGGTVPYVVSKVAVHRAGRVLRQLNIRSSQADVIIDELTWAAYGMALFDYVDDKTKWNKAAYTALTDVSLTMFRRDSRLSQGGES